VAELPEVLVTARPAVGARSFRDALGTWLERHAQTLVASLGRLVRQPFATTLTVAVIGLALALPACLHLVITNARSVTANFEESVQLSVYLEDKVGQADARRIADEIAARDDVGQVRLVSPDEGLEDFKRLSGFGDALKALQGNPLPFAIVVRPAKGFDGPVAVDGLAGDLRAIKRVDLVQVDTAWVRRLQAILEVLRRIVQVAAVLFALGVLAVVGNTIRLDINSRRDEIEVTKLGGGSNAFVRRPFLYAGFWYGLAGALVAWITVAIAVSGVREPVARLAAEYGSGFRLQGLDGEAVLAVLGVGSALGWIGAWVSATYHLRMIEPRA
jgi:cell division transport system permease protein